MTEEAKTQTVLESMKGQACQTCKHKEGVRCIYHNIFVARKNCCDNWSKKR